MPELFHHDSSVAGQELPNGTIQPARLRLRRHYRFLFEAFLVEGFVILVYIWF